VAGKPSEDRKRMRNREIGRSRQEKDTALDMTLIWIVFYIFLFSIFLCQFSLTLIVKYIFAQPYGNFMYMYSCTPLQYLHNIIHVGYRYFI